MKEYALDLWGRAIRALQTARNDAEREDYDASASRSYYAAFYAISALLALEGKTFRKHSAVEAALHKYLVKEGRLSADRGVDYRSLRILRNTGDYGGLEHVTYEQAAEATHAAQRIIDSVREIHPELADTRD